MSNTFSVKPEKCAILQETVKQIKQIKQGTTGNDSAVQQSHVSSSKPAILADDILGPLLLEALDGFLFVVNSQGKVEFVSDNVTQFIKYTQDDLIGKSVYNIIHVGDHALFSNSLLPMSVSSGIGAINWPLDNLGGKGRVFNCRLLIKPSCNDNDDLETKQTYVHQYESLQISSILHPADAFGENSDTTDSSSSLVCIARRLPLAEKTNTMLGVEQFTTKQDLNGKIIGCDISGIAPGRFNCPDFVGQNIQEFCHSKDLQQLSKHLQEAIKNGSNTSGVYRFKMQENRYAFVQTKSKLFQNRISGTSEFIMSTHSIIRECDSDNELKGSASASLMKSIIGPAIQKATPPISNVNTSLANMAIVGNNVMTGLNPSSLYGLSDSSGEDFLSQLTWDVSMADSSVSSSGTSNINSSFHNVTNTATSNNGWSSQLKLSQVQQQLQRSLSSTSHSQRSTPTNMNMGGANKRPVNLIGQIGQRSSSVDLGQMQGQGQMPHGQRSPGFSQSPGPLSRSGGFQIPPVQRGVMGYNRRSPAASPIPGMGQGAFGGPFPPRTPSPMLSSPSPGISQAGWGHQPMASPVSHSGHNPFDEHNTATQEQLLNHLTGGLESIINEKKSAKRPTGKLCQLLTQNSPPSSSRKSEPGTPKSGRSRHNSRQGYMEMSPADSIQSPQPGPGQSPPEKPQSTSNDDGDHLVHTENKDSNRLLKSLLSQDDDFDEETRKEEKASKTGEQTAEAQALQQQQASSTEMEKNEAEAKKPNNILLKQLLSTDDGSILRQSESRKNSVTDSAGPSIIHKLLDEDKKENCRSVPAESTSIDADLARQRHQSGPQEPQSTTTHPLPIPPLSSPLTSPVTPNFSQSQGGNTDSSLLKGLFSSSAGISVNQSVSSTSSVTSIGSTSEPMMTNSREESYTTRDITQNKKIDKLLHLLWDDNSNDGSQETMRERIQNLKRKADMLEASDSDNDSVFSSGGSKLSKDNALLTQLLSKKASNNDIVVNTLSTIQPSGIPQQRFPQNLANKLLKVHPSSFNTASSAQESKRQRIESTGGMSTLERALQAPKQDLNAVSSTQSFDALMDVGQNSNSGISNISDSSVSSQFKEQFSELQQIFQSTINDASGSGANITEVNLDDNTDPLLAQILQQAQDLQQDLSSGSFLTQNQNIQQTLNLHSGGNKSGVMNSDLTVNTSSANTMNQKNSGNINTADLVQQLEQALNESNFNLADMDLFLGNNNVASVDEQIAIDAIQKQLMMEMSGLSSGVSTSNVQTPPLQSGRAQTHFGQSMTPTSQSLSGSQLSGNQLSPGRVPSGRGQYPGSSPSPLHQGIGAQGRPMQLPGYSQTGPGPVGQNFQGQGPRLAHPQGALPSPTQPPRPMFANSSPNSTAIQVRQSLLHQQKMKQIRERSKQQQDRQKLLLQQQQIQQQQQQQRAQFSPQYQRQRLAQETMGMGGGNSVMPQFPENLAELMNSGTAPNVTLQRNQIPGPMSPRYQSMSGQPPQSPSIGSMLPPNTQLSPNFSQQQQQQQQQQQWNGARPSQGNLGMSPQAGSQFNNRNRSLSGGTLQTSSQQRFPFTDNQYGGNQQMGNMFSQQQQMYQNRNGQLQRQLSMPSRGGSPRTSQSPFGTGSDPMLMSPHNVSPNSMRGPQQVSPNYGQTGGIGPGYGQGSMGTQPSSLSSSQYSQNQGQGLQSHQGMPGQGHMGLGASSIDLELESLFDNSKKPLDVPLSVNTMGSSKTIKDELRNLCNSRTQGQVQSGLQSQGYMSSQSSMPSQGHMMQQSPHYMSTSHPTQLQQQNQLQQQQHTMDHDSVSELPLDILEQINEMSAEHGINNVNDFKEEVIVPKKREEAKSRYNKFQQLANSEDPDSKATNLFRKQLTLQTAGRPSSTSDTLGSLLSEPPSSVNIVQSEPRTPIEEIKPANQKDSLLQQLLSD